MPIVHLFNSVVNRGSLESSDLLRGIVDKVGCPAHVVSNASVNWHNENISKWRQPHRHKRRKQEVSSVDCSTPAATSSRERAPLPVAVVPSSSSKAATR